MSGLINILNISAARIEQQCGPWIKLFIPQKLNIGVGQSFHRTNASCRSSGGEIIRQGLNASCITQFISLFARYFSVPGSFAVWTNECAGTRCKSSYGEWIEQRTGLRPICAVYGKFVQRALIFKR